MKQPPRASSRPWAVAGAVAGVAAVSLVAAVPGSPYLPRLPGGAGPWGPLRWLADTLGLDSLSGGALAAVAVAALVVAAGSFLYALREAWRGTLSVPLVVGLAIAFHGVVLLLPLLFSRDVYSYGAYGRMWALHGANPYVATPAEFPSDPVASLVGPQWEGTSSVYGPAFTMLSAGLARVAQSPAGLIAAFRLVAAGASLGTLLLVARLARRTFPERAPFAVALVGLNPVLLFHAVGGGHNDLLVALAVVGALALLCAGREVLAVAVLTLGALVKVTAALPLLLLVVVFVARAEPGRRAPAAALPLSVVGGLTALFVAPFAQTRDPTLGLSEVATHEGWLAVPRFVGRVLGAVVGTDTGASVAVRALFAVALLAVLALLIRDTLRRPGHVTPRGGAAGWGWGLLFLTLLGPVLLPWYLAWTLPLAWVLPAVPRVGVVALSALAAVSLAVAERSQFPGLFDGMALFTHYVGASVVLAILAWTVRDFRARLRAGAPLEQGGRVPAGARQG